MKKSVHLNYFENLTALQTFLILNNFDNNCQTQIERTPFDCCFCEVCSHFSGQGILVF